MDLVFAARGVLQEHRQLRQIDEALHVVVLAGDGAQVDDLGVFGQRELHLVEIGQLVARGIDGPEIGIALQHPGLAVDRLHHAPRRERRHIRIEPPVGFDLEHLRPVVEARRLGLLVEGLDRAVFRQELLEVMRRRVEAELALLRTAGAIARRRPACRRRAGSGTGSADRRTRTRRWSRRPCCIRPGLPLTEELRRRRFDEVLVLVHVLEPEHESRRR